jgi:hypothetical protein
MIHKLFSTVLGLTVATLLFMQMSPTFGTAMYERTKWVGEYFSVGSSEQFHIDGDGDITTTGSVTLGSDGTVLAGIKSGSCTIWAGATTIVASSTAQVECQGGTGGGITAISGVTSDSICSLQNASSTSTLFGGIVVGGVSASSTSGTIVARIANFTGATFTWNATASSSAKWTYSCIDPA